MEDALIELSAEEEAERDALIRDVTEGHVYPPQTPEHMACLVGLHEHATAAIAFLSDRIQTYYAEPDPPLEVAMQIVWRQMPPALRRTMIASGCLLEAWGIVFEACSAAQDMGMLTTGIEMSAEMRH